MSKMHQEGLKSLKKRIKEGDILILQADKTGKFTAVDKSTYLKMGETHVKGDKVIDHDQITQIQREANGHVSMIQKFTSIGENWGHEARMRRV